MGSLETSGSIDAVHLGVQYRAALLDAPIVSAADDPVVDDEDGADGDSTFSEPLTCFVDRGLKEWVHAKLGSESNFIVPFRRHIDPTPTRCDRLSPRWNDEIRL
jgi:hypothetical protein